jgi:lipid-binding SYLF domain-containing protein
MLTFQYLKCGMWANLAFAIFGCLFGCLGCSGLGARSPAELRDARGRAAEELAKAVAILENVPDLPAGQRERARCVVVTAADRRPGVVTIGGPHGRGVVTCRVGTAWSAPAFVSLTSGSDGPRLDVEHAETVMLVMSERAMSQLFRPTFVLGADASVAAGQAEGRAAPDAEILSYARAGGRLSGADLGGTFVSQDSDALVAMYGEDPDVPGVLGGGVRVPGEAAPLLARVAADFRAPRVASSSW